MSKILMLLKVTCGGPLIYMHKNRGEKRKNGPHRVDILEYKKISYNGFDIILEHLSLFPRNNLQFLSIIDLLGLVFILLRYYNDLFPHLSIYL